MLGHLRTDSSLIVQNWKPPERDSERSEESIFFVFLRCLSSWAPRTHCFEKVFQKKISPTLWVYYKHQIFLRKPFSLRLISLAEKWIEGRCPVRWDWFVEIVRPRI